MKKIGRKICLGVIFTAILMLSGCKNTPSSPSKITVIPNWQKVMQQDAKRRLPADIVSGVSIYRAVYWRDLPGFLQDDLSGVWQAWLQNCKASTAVNRQFCTQVHKLVYANEQQRRLWLIDNFQPYQVLDKNSRRPDGVLTAYYEPVLAAKRLPDAQFDIPVYSPPAGLSTRRWFSRQEIDSSVKVKRILRNNVILYLSDPVQAMKLHIQGSGRVEVLEPDGTISNSRIAYGGTNNHPYQSIAIILRKYGHISDTSWDAVHKWGQRTARHLVKRMLGYNPRYVFFNEEKLNAADMNVGPKGALGVPLTPKRSVAVDPNSIAYGSLLWLQSSGPKDNLARLVFAQDTGAAIRGAVRADYFVGWDAGAEQYASTLKQDLKLWILLPKNK